VKREGLRAGDVVAEQRSKYDEPKPVMVIDPDYTVGRLSGRFVLVRRVNEQTFEPTSGKTYYVPARALTGKWEDAVVERDRLRAEKKAADEAREEQQRQDQAVAQEIDTLTGRNFSSPARVYNSEVVVSLEYLLDLIKAARTLALDEAEGTGGRFGPAPS
jgi:hypothetical protein